MKQERRSQAVKPVSRTRTLVFFDTSSLLVSCWNGDERKGEEIVHDHAKESTFWTNEIPRLAETGRLVLATRNHDELVKHSRSSQKKDLAKRANYTLAKLSSLISAGTIEIAGDSNDPFADAVLLSVALKFRTQANLHFITQDRALAKDLQRIIEFESVRPRGGQYMSVSRVARDGRVRAFSDLIRDPRQRKTPTVESATDRTTPASVPASKPWWEKVGLGKA